MLMRNVVASTTLLTPIKTRRNMRDWKGSPTISLGASPTLFPGRGKIQGSGPKLGPPSTVMPKARTSRGVIQNKGPTRFRQVVESLWLRAVVDLQATLKEDQLYRR